MNNTKEIAWRMILPCMVGTIMVFNPFAKFDIYDGWSRLLVLVPRFVLYFVLCNTICLKQQAVRLVTAFLIEAVALTIISWVFGRSIM